MAIIGFYLCMAIAFISGITLVTMRVYCLLASLWWGWQDYQWRNEYAKQVSFYRTFMRRCEL